VGALSPRYLDVVRAERGTRDDTRRQRADGERSRSAILAEAARLVTVEGIEGLSISRLAEAVGMSKSGLYAHFGSKEELQLATIDAASAIFTERVIEPGQGAASGLDALQLTVEAYLRHLEVDTFPGGCFFASVLAEVDMRPGPVRDRLIAFLDDWLALLARHAQAAQAEGTIDPAAEPEQLAFEIEAALLLANAQWVVGRTHEPLDRARRAVQRVLGSAALRG
jgi:AcrR family transcriptional regulator